MANLRIVPRNFHDEATLATELAPVTGYPIANTQDTQRSRVWRSTAGTNQYIAGTYADGLLRTASFAGFFRHRCHGGNVRLQLYSDAAYTTQVYDSGTVAIINVTPTDGLDWGITPYVGGTAIDPFITDAPFWLWFSGTPHRSFKWSFSSNVSTYGYAYWQVCRFFLGNYFSLTYNPQYGITLGVVDQTDRNRSRGASLRTNVGPSWRTMTMDLARIPESERAAWLDIMKYLGTGRDFVSSLFPGEATRRERDHTINCKFTSLDPLERWHLQYLKKRLQFEEV